jgi:hypothetical protein
MIIIASFRDSVPGYNSVINKRVLFAIQGFLKSFLKNYLLRYNFYMIALE